MENSKGQTIFLSVIGVATLLVAIIGATFAWFSVEVQGNESAQSVYVETMKLGSVVFTDNNAITLTQVKPMTLAQAQASGKNTKTFSVAQSATDATETLTYTISLEVTDPELTQHDDDYFVHSLSGSSSKTDEGAADRVVSVSETAVPGDTSNNLGTGTLVGYETHNYTYLIYLKEANDEQNDAQGRSFAGKLQVSLSQTQYSGQ